MLLISVSAGVYGLGPLCECVVACISFAVGDFAHSKLLTNLFRSFVRESMSDIQLCTFADFAAWKTGVVCKGLCGTTRWHIKVHFSPIESSVNSTVPIVKNNFLFIICLLQLFKLKTSLF